MLSLQRVLLIVSAFTMVKLHISAAQCSGTVKVVYLGNAETGSISIPRPSGVTYCRWRIVAPYDQRVLMYFTSFDLRGCCSCHNVQIFDGSSDFYHPLLTKGCNVSFPRPVYSSDRYIYMKYTSQWYYDGRGFSAHYKALSQNSVCPSINLAASAGVIYSPNFPWSYPSSTSCSWTISAPREKLIYLNFINMNLEPSSSCSYDYVAVQPPRRKYCGSAIPSTVLSYNSTMEVTFHSDSLINYQGFMAFYQIGNNVSLATAATATAYPYYTTPYYTAFPYTRYRPYYTRTHPHYFNPTTSARSSNPDCKPHHTRVYVGISGSLTLDGWRSDSYYNYNYYYYPICTWEIHTDDENILELTFDTMAVDMDYSYACSDAYVQVIDGGSPSGTTIGRYCNKNYPKIVLSTRNQFFISFYSRRGRDSFGATVRAKKAVGAVKAVAIAVPIAVGVVLFTFILIVIKCIKITRSTGTAASSLAYEVPLQTLSQ